ncbi:glycosyl hydrolase family 18 protein [Kitasatospora cystarginea]|uniref:glycosyl hydrolase family 18 protein n=1 Tax=Kitasatospora cystarginea TaxID=58350 RepID=UPI0031D5E99E
MHGPSDCPGACVTNHQSALHSVPEDPSPRRLSVEAAVKAWTDAGAPKKKLLVGVPFYGRGWEGVQSTAKNGLFQQASGAVSKANGAKYAVGVNDYRTLAPLAQQGYQVHRDDANGVAWLFNPDKRIFWTFDDPMAAYRKAEFAKEQGLAGAMSYSLEGDDKSTAILSEHIRAALDGRQPPTPPPLKDACTAPEWRTDYVYGKPSVVSHAGKMWRGQYWTKGTAPGSKDGGGGSPWRELRTCKLPARLHPNGAKPWQEGLAYETGTMVTHQGELHTAAYNIRPDQAITPGTDVNTWQPHGKYETAGV